MPAGPEARRFVVITGATRGCGRALAEALIRTGHLVAGCGTREDLCRELSELHGFPHRFDPVDVRKRTEVRTWASTLLDSHGPPDLLVNNAGAINRNAPLWEVPAEELERVLAVNLLGTALVVQGFVPAMLARGSGVIVNFSSTWGRSTSPEVAPYCASKWGVEGLTRALAQELPRGLAAVAVNPGIIDTEMLRSCFGGGAASYPEPENWARSAAPFLLGLGPGDNGSAATVP